MLLLITHRKSHTGFRLVPTSMTLNDLEQCNSPYFAFFLPKSIALLPNFVTVVEDTYDVGKILSPSSSLLLFALTNPPCSPVCDVGKILSPSSSLLLFALTNPPCSPVCL